MNIEELLKELGVDDDKKESAIENLKKYAESEKAALVKKNTELLSEKKTLAEKIAESEKKNATEKSAMTEKTSESNKEIEELRNQIAKMTAEAKRKDFEAEIIKSASDKFADGAIDDVLLRAKAAFELTDEGYKSKDGQDINSFLQSLEKNAAHLLKQQTASVAPRASDYKGKTNPFAKDSINVTEQAKIFRENPELAKILQSEAAN